MRAVLITTCMLFASVAHAGKRTVAVFGATTLNPTDQSRADALSNKWISELRQLARKDITLIAGPKLQRALNDKPARALARCGGSPRCAATLAKRAGADEALLMSVANADNGLQLLIVAVDAERAQITRTVVAASPSWQAARSQVLRPKWREALGLEEAAAGDDLVALPETLEDAPKVEPPRAPAQAPLATKVESSPRVETAPAKTIAETSVAAPNRGRPLLVTGVVLLATAAVAGGVGAYYGVVYAQAPRTAPANMTQVAYVDVLDQANRAGLIANISIAAAGTLAATGLVLLIVDLARGRSPAGVLTTTPTTGGAVATYGSAF